MTLLQSYQLASSGGFQNLVRMSALSQAIVVLGETSISIPRVQDKRNALAVSTVQDGCTSNLTRFVYGIAAVPGFAVNPVDADINSAMVSQWNNFSLVTKQDLSS